jgi:hypothetical protein
MEPLRGDPLDDLLGAYDDQQQEETRRQVETAERLEKNRRVGSEVLRSHALEVIRDAGARLERAGHRVLIQELLRNYPPSLRLHVWPRPGPMDPGDARRSTLEFVWGDPVPDQLSARRWGWSGLGAIADMDSAVREDADTNWAREQLLDFLKGALGGR